MRGTNMTVEEMRTLRKMLVRRIEDYEARKEERIKKLLADPTDRNIEVQLTLIHEDEKHIEEIWAVSRELKFDIEDITGEVEEEA